MMSVEGRKYPCEYCDLSFANPKQLSMHSIKIHNKLSSRTCHICDKTFSAPYKVREHADAMHKNLRHYCPESGCPKNFPWRRSLEGHMKSVHKKRLLPARLAPTTLAPATMALSKAVSKVMSKVKDRKEAEPQSTLLRMDYDKIIASNNNSKKAFNRPKDKASMLVDASGAPSEMEEESGYESVAGDSLIQVEATQTRNPNVRSVVSLGTPEIMDFQSFKVEETSQQAEPLRRKVVSASAKRSAASASAASAASASRASALALPRPDSDSSMADVDALITTVAPPPRRSPPMPIQSRASLGLPRRPEAGAAKTASGKANAKTTAQTHSAGGIANARPCVKLEPAVPLEECDESELKRRLKTMAHKKQSMENRARKMQKRLSLMELDHKKCALTEEHIKLLLKGFREERARQIAAVKREIIDLAESDVEDAGDVDDGQDEQVDVGGEEQVEVEEEEMILPDGLEEAQPQVIHAWHTPPE